MNDQKQRRRIPLAFLVLVFLTALFLSPVLAGAENEATVKIQPQAVTGQPQATSPEAENKPPDTQQAAGQTPPATSTPAKPIEKFEPTEKIGADSAVSFPIDI